MHTEKTHRLRCELEVSEAFEVDHFVPVKPGNVSGQFVPVFSFLGLLKQLQGLKNRKMHQLNLTELNEQFPIKPKQS